MAEGGYGEQVTQRRWYKGGKLGFGKKLFKWLAMVFLRYRHIIPKREGLCSSKRLCRLDMNSMLTTAHASVTEAEQWSGVIGEGSVRPQSRLVQGLPYAAEVHVT